MCRQWRGAAIGAIGGPRGRHFERGESAASPSLLSEESAPLSATCCVCSAPSSTGSRLHSQLKPAQQLEGPLLSARSPCAPAALSQPTTAAACGTGARMAAAEAGPSGAVVPAEPAVDLNVHPSGIVPQLQASGVAGRAWGGHRPRQPAPARPAGRRRRLPLAAARTPPACWPAGRSRPCVQQPPQQTKLMCGRRGHVASLPAPQGAAARSLGPPPGNR